MESLLLTTVEGRLPLTEVTVVYPMVYKHALVGNRRQKVSHGDRARFGSLDDCLSFPRWFLVDIESTDFMLSLLDPLTIVLP